MLRDLNAILDYVAELNELDTSGVVPLAQVSELAGVAPPAPRPDLISAFAHRALVMARRRKPTAFFSKCRK